MKDEESMTIAAIFSPFRKDEFGRVSLTTVVKEDIAKAERDLENGKCFSEADFKERFAKWLYN